MAGEKPKKEGGVAQEGTGFSRVFGDVANKTSQAAGRASAFIFAAGLILVWAITGLNLESCIPSRAHAPGIFGLTGLRFKIFCSSLPRSDFLGDICS